MSLYQRAVDLYVDRGFLNNAIALCNKILRQDPQRAEVHLRLGRMSFSKGFRADARRSFQEFATIMRRAGQLESALATLREIADATPDFDEARLLLADLYATSDRVPDAVAQLERVRDLYAGRRPG